MPSKGYLKNFQVAFYSELNLNQYSVGSPCRTICTVCGSPPCPDLNLIHYSIAAGMVLHAADFMTAASIYCAESEHGYAMASRS